MSRYLAEAVKFAYILQAAVWLASQTLRTSHAMCAGTLLASKAKVPMRGLFNLAEAVRFELTEGANPRRFSRPVP